MYQKMYLTLFNAVTDALELMEKGCSAEAAALLRRAQQSTEDQYINAGEGDAPIQAQNMGPIMFRDHT